MAHTHTHPYDLPLAAAVDRAGHRSLPAAVGRAAKQLAHTLHVWRCRIEEREQLRKMNEHMLKDIGIDRADAYREASKPFWRE